MKDYKGNSHVSRNNEEAKVIKKVANARTRKKNEMRKLADAIVADSVTNVKDYIVADIIIPTIKETLYDIVTNGLRMSLFGENAPAVKKRSDSSKVRYTDYYDKPTRERDRGSRTRLGYVIDDVLLDSRGEAEQVLDAMDDMIDKYGFCSVADFYESVGKRGRHTDHNYGWDNLSNARVVYTRDGYELKLPRPIPYEK